MAVGPIEMSTIARAQDYTTIKHNEDNKTFVDQTNIGQQLNRNVEQMTRQVHSSDNSDWQNKKFDAKEKGSNTYSGEEGKKRDHEKQQKEQVVINRHQGFDIKI